MASPILSSTGAALLLCTRCRQAFPLCGHRPSESRMRGYAILSRSSHKSSTVEPRSPFHQHVIATERRGFCLVMGQTIMHGSYRFSAIDVHFGLERLLQ
jgi:hypothetical protein